MAKKTEYARWKSIMKKLDNQIKKDEEERKVEIAEIRKEKDQRERV